MEQKQDTQDTAKSLVLVQPDSTNFVSLQSIQLANAIEDTKIFRCEEEELSKVFFYVMTKVGLRAGNMPDAEEWVILHDHVRKLCGHYTLAEIRLAFDMAVDDKLDLTKEEVKCYENFSCLYFSTIMNAYRRWAREEIKHLPKKPVLMIENRESMSDEAMRQWLASTVQKVRNDPHYPIEFVPSMLCDWLEAKGKIAISPERVAQYLGRATDLRRSILKKRYSDNPSVANKNNLKDLDEMLEYCQGDLAKVEGAEVEIIKSLVKRLVLHDLIRAGHFEPE